MRKGLTLIQISFLLLLGLAITAAIFKLTQPADESETTITTAPTSPGNPLNTPQPKTATNNAEPMQPSSTGVSANTNSRLSHEEYMKAYSKEYLQLDKNFDADMAKQLPNLRLTTKSATRRQKR